MHMYAYLNVMRKKFSFVNIFVEVNANTSAFIQFKDFFYLSFVWREEKIFENRLLSTSIEEDIDDTSNHTWSHLAFIEWLDNNAEQHNNQNWRWTNGKYWKCLCHFSCRVDLNSPLPSSPEASCHHINKY